MTRAQTTAWRLRWLLLVCAGVCWAAGAFWLINILWPRWEFLPSDAATGAGLQGVMGWWFDEEWAYWVTVAMYMGAFLVTQWLFLAPRGLWRLRADPTGRPLRRSVVAAGLMAGALTAGLLATVLELGGWWLSFAFTEPLGQDMTSRCWPPLLALGVAWAGWAAVFFAYWRQGDHYTQLGRMIRGLIAGSVLELLVASPAHAMGGDPDNCYCARGSYTGLVLGVTVLLWCFGPGIILLFWRERWRMERLSASAGHATGDAQAPQGTEGVGGSL